MKNMNIILPKMNFLNLLLNNIKKIMMYFIIYNYNNIEK